MFGYRYGFGRGFGRGFGFSYGRIYGWGSPTPYCRAYPWLPRGWWKWGYYPFEEYPYEDLPEYLLRGYYGGYSREEEIYAMRDALKEISDTLTNIEHRLAELEK